MTKEDDMTTAMNSNVTPSATGAVLHSAARYDLLVWLLTLGRERAFREKIVRLARLNPLRRFWMSAAELEALR